MSDRPQGEGWWLAADKRWYPPDTQPGEPLPPPPGTTRHQPPPGVARRRLSPALTYTTFGVLLGTGVAYLAYTAATIAYLLVIRAEDTASATVGLFAQSEDLVAAEFFYFAALAIAGLATLASAGLFITWCYHAYRAAASQGATGNNWSPGWAIGVWFIPLANLVLPRLVLGEMERMSHPTAGTTPIGDSWKKNPVELIGRLWWVIFVGAYVLSTISLTVQSPTLDDATFELWVMVEAVAGLLYVVAAALGAIYVLRMGRRLAAGADAAQPLGVGETRAPGSD